MYNKDKLLKLFQKKMSRTHDPHGVPSLNLKFYIKYVDNVHFKPASGRLARLKKKEH